MDLKRLRYFKTIVDHNSIGEAAKALNIAQPPLSQRLQELERELGVELLVRSGKSFKLTEAGRVLYQYACDILKQVEDAEKATVLAANQKKKSVRLGLSPLHRSYFTSLISEFQKNPDIDLEVKVTDSSHLEFLLNSNRIDLALMQRPRNVGIYHSIELSAPEAVCVVSKSIEDAGLSIWPLSKLRDFPLLLVKRADGVGTYESVLTHLRKHDVYPRVAMTSTDPRLLLECLERGMRGIAIVPASEVGTLDLTSCYIVRVSPAICYFQPTIVRLKSSLCPPELTEIIDKVARKIETSRAETPISPLP